MQTEALPPEDEMMTDLATDNTEPQELDMEDSATEDSEDVRPVLAGATATYDPADNKLRLYPLSRLSPDLYARVKAAGFCWAPKQELFVAPAWSPERNDLLLELVGEIGDEDTTLVERAEERSERFEDYSGRRLQEAESARRAVDAIADHIPFGQPILVGHHSERRARKDAERIQNGMRRAVDLWKTSKYWTDRAAGALSHAKYKELPGVRHRRIKGIEADKRKVERSIAESERNLRLWTAVANEQDPAKQREMALAAANACWLNLPRKEGDKPDFDGSPTAYCALTNDYPNLYAPRTLEEVVTYAVAAYSPPYTRRRQWIDHYDNRIAYERAMLEESGGLKAEGFDLAVGGKILASGLWLTITKLNKSGGAINSVSTNNKSYPRVVPIERIKEHQPPAPEDVAAVKAATKLAPLCNYPEAVLTVLPHTVNPVSRVVRVVELTKAEWDRTWKDHKTTREIKGTEEFGRHRVRALWRGENPEPVYLIDQKRKDPPPPDQREKPAIAPVTRDLPSLERQAARSIAFRAEVKAEEENPFAQLADSLKAGVKVVSAPQLFPTPEGLARRVVKLADIEPRHRVLEPSAGTGAILREIPWGYLSAVEINHQLAELLCDSFGNRVSVTCADFLALTTEAFGRFDRIVMNPPFGGAADIKHIQHAATFLAPGGRLVAICANGPRQSATLRAIAREYIELPPGSFEASGTSVNSALVVIENRTREDA